MGLQQNLQDIQTNLLSAKTAIAQSIAAKGVECSADEALSTYATKIDSISGGSTGGTGEKFVVPNGLKFGYSTAFDPSLFDVSQVTSMSCMFYNCSGLTGELDLSNWNTANVTSMSYMFYNCSGLTGELDLSNWNTANVTNMSNMFKSCSDLTSLNISNWNTANVTNMSSMFEFCSKITTLDLSTWSTSNVEYMNYQFEYCSKITTLDLSTWDTSNVADMRNMFLNCSGLTELDLSNWNLSNLREMGGMFYNCKSLTNLQLPDLGHYNGTLTLDLTSCSALTKDSVLYLFNNAFDRTAAGYGYTFTIKLNAKTKALLSEDEIAIATNKGFTVV